MNLFKYLKYNPLLQKKKEAPVAPYVSQFGNEGAAPVDDSVPAERQSKIIVYPNTSEVPFETPSWDKVPKSTSRLEPKYQQYQEYLDALAGPQDRSLTEKAKMDAYGQQLDQLGATSSPVAPEVQPDPEQPIPTPGSFGVLESDKNAEPEAQKQDTISNFLKRFQPKKTQLDFGTGTEASKENLQNAQDARSDGELVNRLGKASELIGTGFSRAKPVAQGLFDDNIKAAGQPVKDLEERIAMEKHDPNSSYSKGFKEYLKKFGVEVSGDFTGVQGEKMIPWALSQYNNDLHRQTQLAQHEMSAKERAREFDQKAESLKLSKEQLKQHQTEVKDSKESVQLDKRFDTMGKLLTAEVASSRSAFGKGANIYRSAEAIENLVAQMKDPNNMDSRQIAEVARNLDAMLSSGAATISGTQKLIPHTAAGDIATIKEYVLSLPAGAQQGEFVKRMLETVVREKELAKEQVKRTQGKLLGSYSNLREKDRARWDLMLKHHELPTDIFDDEVKESQPTSKLAQTGLVKVRRKKDGLTKTVSAQEAQQILSDPNFEQVQ